jgi:L-seryl-tRNA(Ser) seleniumtransferase
MPSQKELLRALPKVDDLLNHDKIQNLTQSVSRQIVVDAIREKTEELRRWILNATDMDLPSIDIEMVIDEITQSVLTYHAMNLKRVINATGVILHTNLGRAPLYEGIKDQVWDIAENYSTLEFNVVTGKRGSRYDHVEELMTRLIGCESALVVNNNAAAVLLILSTMAKGKEVIVSRGELVEIGGSFRVPEIMEQSGAELVEVGATNKTHLRDYQKSIVEGKTGALLKVHTSNFRILGFTDEVSLTELVKLGHEHDIPVIHDLGSGALIDFCQFGITDEATVADSVASQADIICFSGDKLMGGPQAGIIIGKKSYIDQMKKNPLTRAFRIDKLTLAALEATLRLYFDPEKALTQIPLLKMITCPLTELTERANALYALLQERRLNSSLTLEDGMSQVGGGSMPLQELPTRLIAMKPWNCSVQALEDHLRGWIVPIIVRIHKDQVYFDLRTIKDSEFEYIADALSARLNESRS